MSFINASVDFPFKNPRASASQSAPTFVRRRFGLSTTLFPSVVNSTAVPGFKPWRLRIRWGIVTWPLLVTSMARVIPVAVLPARKRCPRRPVLRLVRHSSRSGGGSSPEASKPLSASGGLAKEESCSRADLIACPVLRAETRRRRTGFGKRDFGGEHGFPLTAAIPSRVAKTPSGSPAIARYLQKTSATKEEMASSNDP